MTLYGAKPDSLIYHNHEFNIQDVVVTVKNNRKDNLDIMFLGKSVFFH